MNVFNNIVKHFFVQARIDAKPEALIHYNICICKFADDFISVFLFAYLVKGWLAKKIAGEEHSGLNIILLKILN